MTAGLLQLAAKGPDDIFIIDDPQITFFKIVYRRHTNYCMYPNYLHFNKELDFGQESRCKLQFRGDIVSRLYFEIILPDIYMKLNEFTRRTIKNILKENFIDWEYNADDDEIVTYEIYLAEIVPTINDQIYNYINMKNMLEEEYLTLKKSEKYFKSEPKISNALNLIHYLLNEKINKTKYYELIIFLINKIDQLKEENKRLITELYLYNFDDILNAIYNELILRLSDKNQPEYINILYIYEYGDILLYNVVDNGNYIFTQQNMGTNVSIYFNNIIGESIIESEFENNIMSFVILKEHFNYLDKKKETIYHNSDISKYKQYILDTIEWNIKKNISIISFMLSVLINNDIRSDKCFRMTIYKNFIYKSDNNYLANGLFNFIDNRTFNDPNLFDYFGDYLKLNKNEPNNIQYFFLDKTSNKFIKMRNNINTIYNFSYDTKYTNDINLWKNLTLDKIIDSSEYEGILLMNIMPVILIKEIPIYLLDNIKKDEILYNYYSYFDENNKIKLIEKKLSDLVKKKYVLNNSLQDYIKSLNKNIVKNGNKILTSIFLPELFFNFYHYSTNNDCNVKLLLEFECSENINNENINIKKLLLIELILYLYLITYFEIIDEIMNEDRISCKKIIYNMLKVYRYTDFVNRFPSYDIYKNNNYSLYKINENIMEDESVVEPLYSDAISSIYYDFEKKKIQEYNNFFNQIFDYNSVNINIGSQISKIIYVLTDRKIINYFYNDIHRYKLIYINNNYIQKYLKLFSKDLIQYNNNRKIFTIKNIFFKEKNNYYFKSKVEIKDYIKDVLINSDTYYNQIVDIIDSIIKQMETEKHGTVNEFLMQLQTENELLNEIIKKNFDMNNSETLYYEQKKLGIFNSLRYKKEVIEYIIFLIYKEFDLESMYDHIYYYKNNYSAISERLEFYYVLLTNDQKKELLKYCVYCFYLNTSIRIREDYNIPNNIEGTYIYINVLDNFTQDDYIKYNIESSNIVILKLIPLIYNFDQLRFLIIDDYKNDIIKENIDNINNSEKNALQEDYISLIKTHDNLEKYYTNEISRISKKLGNISINNNKLKKFSNNNYIYEGSKLEDTLLKLIKSDKVGFKWIQEIGHYIIDTISLQIGGQTIEVHDSNWNRAQHMIFYEHNHKEGYDKMIGNIPELYMDNKSIKQDGKAKDQYILMIPINFWFSKDMHPGLPLVAMQYCDVDIIVKLRNLEEIAIWNENAYFIKKPKLKCQILANYIYVEKEERKRLCETRLEYLIETLQKNGDMIISKNNIIKNSFNIELNFNNSSKFLFWQVKLVRNQQSKEEKFKWTDDNVYISETVKNEFTGEEKIKYRQINPINNITIKFNGKIRESKKESIYYNLTQPYKAGSSNLSSNMYLYTFALDITKYQPTGTANLSQINNIILTMELNSAIMNEINSGNLIIKIGVYNYSYNILRIMSGLAGLAFYS